MSPPFRAIRSSAQSIPSCSRSRSSRTSASASGPIAVTAWVGWSERIASGRCRAASVIAPFFEGASMDRLRNMQREFFGAALDGPIRYGGRSLVEVHAGRGIEVRHFARFVEHLLETLKGQGLDEDDVYEIISRVNTYVDQVTGQGSIGA